MYYIKRYIYYSLEVTNNQLIIFTEKWNILKK